ncbi:MAG: hypothetical protein M3286_07445 [Thermoproteota archaeon]|nr:hypothetical protein [Thermoproteota archaeon]
MSQPREVKITTKKYHKYRLNQRFNNITANSASLKKKVSPSFSYHGTVIDFVLNLGYPSPQRAALDVGRLAV